MIVKLERKRVNLYHRTVREIEQKMEENQQVRFFFFFKSKVTRQAKRAKISVLGVPKCRPRQG